MEGNGGCAKREITPRMAARVGFAFASTASRKTRNPSAIRNTARKRFNRHLPVTPNLDAEISYRWPEEKILVCLALQKRAHRFQRGSASIVIVPRIRDVAIGPDQRYAALLCWSQLHNIAK